MAARKPKVEMYWSWQGFGEQVRVVNWRLVGANGEVMCQSTQGFRDKTDALRSIFATSATLSARVGVLNLNLRITGPGRKTDA